MNSDSQVSTLNLFNHFIGGASGKDVPLSSTSSFDPTQINKLTSNKTVRYFFMAVVLYLAYLFFTGKKIGSEHMSRTGSSRSRSSSSSRSRSSSSSRSRSSSSSRSRSNLSSRKEERKKRKEERKKR
jgi:hypothetical protein